MNKTTDTLFNIGLAVKGVDSVFEVIGGVLLTMPTKLARYLLVLSQHELYKHHHVLSGQLDKLADSVSAHASMGEAIYLAVHGLAKVILIAAIYGGKKWGYLGLMGVLSVFAVIEISRGIYAHEVVTGALALFDIAMVVLIYKEYRARYVDQQS